MSGGTCGSASLVVREHREDDFEWVIAKHGEVYSDEFGFNSDFEKGIAEKIDRIFSSEDNFKRLWIVEIGEVRVGSIGVSKIGKKTGFINFVLVLPEFRGRGVSSELLETVEKYSRENGMSKLELETYDCLVKARELYRKNGFEIIEQNKGVSRFGCELTQEIWSKSLDQTEPS